MRIVSQIRVVGGRERGAGREDSKGCAGGQREKTCSPLDADMLRSNHLFIKWKSPTGPHKKSFNLI